MDIMKLLKTRRSVRKYKPEELSDDVINKIIEAALCAPSGMNKQARKLLVVKGTSNINKLNGIVKTATANASKPAEQQYVDFVGNPNYTINYGAPLFIVVTTENNHNARADAACMLENMFLAAHALGVGSVWINQLNPITDTKEMREFLTKYGVPESYIISGGAAFGYPAESPEAKPIKDGQFLIIDNL